MARKRKTQPVRDIPGGTFGDRQALTEQQQAAPLPVAGETPGAEAAPPAVPPPNPVDVFGPTQRAGQPQSAASQFLPPQPDMDPAVEADLILRELYRVLPSPRILRLIRG